MAITPSDKSSLKSNVKMTNRVATSQCDPYLVDSGKPATRWGIQKGGHSLISGLKKGIILSRNPLSGRNPGISPHRFEIPPPSAFRSCLSMLLETHVGDCSSICRAPAVCPTVSEAHRLVIIILNHHRYLCPRHQVHPPMWIQ